MCLHLHTDSAKQLKLLQERGEPVTCYKIVQPDNKSIYHFEHMWRLGLNISNRKDISLEPEEKTEVSYGFHLFLDKPVDCTHRDDGKKHRGECICPYEQVRSRVPTRRMTKCRCTETKPINKVIICRADPKDIVAVGTWENLNCIVATKVTVIEEI